MRVDGGNEYRCPACGARLDLEDVRRWVRNAEKARDEAYLEVDGEPARAGRMDRQSEVYRRRAQLYGLEESSRAVMVRPEMLLVLYDASEDVYRCRVFYKEPRPAWGVESVDVGASDEAIRALGADGNPAVRLVSEKAGEFHDLRTKLAGADEAVPLRRVFYADEL